MTLEELMDYFRKIIHQVHLSYPYRNPKLMGDINIFEQPFDRSKGYQVYQNDKVKLIMLRFDRIDQWKGLGKGTMMFWTKS
jgi:hypothetical protein